MRAIKEVQINRTDRWTESEKTKKVVLECHPRISAWEMIDVDSILQYKVSRRKKGSAKMNFILDTLSSRCLVPMGHPSGDDH